MDVKEDSRQMLIEEATAEVCCPLANSCPFACHADLEND